MPQSNTAIMLMRFALATITISFVGFLVYWHGIRDNWDIDNFSLINEKCEAIDQAIANSNDNQAALSHTELLQLLDGHQIKHDFIMERIQSSKNAFISVQQRLDKKEQDRKALELAKQQRLKQQRLKSEAIANSNRTTPKYSTYREQAAWDKYLSPKAQARNRAIWDDAIENPEKYGVRP